MRQLLTQLLAVCSLAVVSVVALAGGEAFGPGPQIKGFGEIAAVPGAVLPAAASEFKVAFDVGAVGEGEKPNRKFNSLARFINMHVAAGLKPSNIHLALVVHGKASQDLLSAKARLAKQLPVNPNTQLLKALLENQTQIFLCGQTAAYYDITAADLQSGVQMSLSAMTAHAQLQQQGYTLNPF